MAKKKRRVRIVSLLCVLVALVFTVLYIMPLWNTTDTADITTELKEAYNSFLSASESTNHFTADDMLHPSLYAETKFYHYNGEEYFESQEDPKREALIMTVLMAAPGAAGALLVLLGLFRLPWLMIIVEGIAALALKVDLSLIDVEFKTAATGTSVGIAYLAYYPCLAVLAFLTVLLIIFKISLKRAIRKGA